MDRVDALRPPSLATSVAIVAATLFFSPPVSAQPSASLRAMPVKSPPLLDGRLDDREWPLEDAVPLDHGHVVVVNDSIRLYLLLNLRSDTEVDEADRVTLLFGVDSSGTPSPIAYRRYVLERSNPRLVVEESSGDGSWTRVPGRTASALAGGFDAFFADGSRGSDPAAPVPSAARHGVWEIAIDLAEIGATPGDSVGFSMLIESGSPPIRERFPADDPGPPGAIPHVRVELSDCGPRMTADPLLLGPSVDNLPLEVTQAVQTIDNALPLVSKKATVARAYVSTGIGLVATVELHATRAGFTLAGSPLVALYTDILPTTREDLAHTANFALPDAWPQGTVEFQVVVRDGLGRSDTSAIIPITFTCKETPTYWLVPADLGSGALPSAGTVSGWQSYLATIFPVPEVDWVQQPSLGVVAEDDLIDELAEYHAGWLLAWILGLIATQQEPFPFPDQIIGTVSGAINAGGRSDPVWSSGAAGSNIGAVCWIASNNNGREVGMSHEVNHNLDTDATGTWGRHVSNACDGFAGGTDGAWPYPDDGTQEVGFDTRTPWNASGSPLTVIPADFPGIMSRCKAEDVGYPLGQLPSRWISPYRWESLFERFRTLSPCAVPVPFPGRGIDLIRPMIHLSGFLRADGTGRLRPAFELPGLPSRRGTNGRYAVDLVDETGETIDGHRFPASFVDVEGESIQTSSFRMRLPAEQIRTVRGVRLLRDGRVLDRIVVSPNEPELDVEPPTSGPWSGRRSLGWNARDADGDPLSFRVIYSPDGGSRWFPVAHRVRRRAVEVDTDALPGGRRGKFRVIGSDGFHTVRAQTSGDITVVNKPPRVVADLARRDGEIEAGDPIVLRGRARDLEDGALGGDQLVWSVDGRVIGTGERVRTRLPAGTWDIRLEAVDFDGASSAATVTANVVPREPDDPTEPVFLRSDADGSGTVEITDAVLTLNYLFLGSVEPSCRDALDTDDDGEIALGDAIRTLIFLFQRSIEIPMPFPDCGVDLTADDLGCERSHACTN